MKFIELKEKLKLLKEEGIGQLLFDFYSIFIYI